MRNCLRNIIVLFVYNLISQTVGQKSDHFVQMSDTIIHTDYQSVVARTSIECSTFCARNPDYWGFSYNITSKQCTMFVGFPVILLVSVSPGTRSYYKSNYEILISMVYVSTEMTWSESLSYCESIGGTLMDFPLQFVEILVVAAVQGLDPTGRSFWIGLHEQNGQLVWTSGRTYSHSNFIHGDPTVGTGNCVQIQPNVGWSDVSCNSLRRSSCIRH